ncbi:hypothetical protein OBBRIDRAFT_832970 [Obba rivulosa]|uniref:Uncharacterized protein n=1 Tax=Obba rivulosa TaxID=1052685 RepID=A0A8E2AXW1_9APHY|nr:hypothetical protein OBBRIDRAFT_832970 [Obba rivulosa]
MFDYSADLTFRRLEGLLTSNEPLQLGDEPPYVPPIVRPHNMVVTVPGRLTKSEHRDLNRSIVDELRSYGFPNPTPEDVKSDSYLAARVVLAIFATHLHEYHVRLEFADIDNLIAFVEKNEILRENLADAVEVKTFTLMRCLAFWYEEGPPLDR